MMRKQQQLLMTEEDILDTRHTFIVAGIKILLIFQKQVIYFNLKIININERSTKNQPLFPDFTFYLEFCGTQGIFDRNFNFFSTEI